MNPQIFFSSAPVSPHKLTRHPAFLPACQSQPVHLSFIHGPRRLKTLKPNKLLCSDKPNNLSISSNQCHVTEEENF